MAISYWVSGVEVTVLWVKNGNWKRQATRWWSGNTRDNEREYSNIESWKAIMILLDATHLPELNYMFWKRDRM